VGYTVLVYSPSEAILLTINLHEGVIYEEVIAIFSLLSLETPRIFAAASAPLPVLYLYQ
jgi:hypothetical protein